MQLCVFNGSPRGRKGNTSIILESFLQGFETSPGNSYDIYCDQDVIRCYVNGVLQNVGTNASDTSGWICLQSEGGPIEFRNIYIEPLD